MTLTIKKILFIAFLLFSFSQTAAAKKEELQSLESIHSAAKNFITANTGSTSEYEITVFPLDRRLKLPKCLAPLEVFTPSGTVNNGRLTVGVRCTTKSPWSIFTSAQIKEFKDVIVLSRPIQKGKIISRDTVELKKKEISHLNQNFFMTYDQVLGKQANRHLPVGTVLNSANLASAKIVKRGEKVSIQAVTKMLSIRMTGTAMMDGVKNQRIRVKNEKSNRIIEATVIKSGLVSVSF